MKDIIIKSFICSLCFIILHSCSLLELRRSYYPTDNRSEWKTSDAGLYEHNIGADSININCSSHLQGLSIGPPYIPIVPNFLFFLNMPGKFCVEISHSDCLEIVNVNATISRGRKKRLMGVKELHNQGIRKQTYIFNESNVKNVELQVEIKGKDNKHFLLPVLYLKRRKELEYTPFFMN